MDLCVGNKHWIGKNVLKKIHFQMSFSTESRIIASMGAILEQFNSKLDDW